MKPLHLLLILFLIVSCKNLHLEQSTIETLEENKLTLNDFKETKYPNFFIPKNQYEDEEALESIYNEWIRQTDFLEIVFLARTFGLKVQEYKIK